MGGESGVAAISPVQQCPQAELAAANRAKLAGPPENALYGELSEEVGEVAGVAHPEGLMAERVQRHARGADEELLVDTACEEDEVGPALRGGEHQRWRGEVAEDDGAGSEPGHDRMRIAHLGEGDVEALIAHRAALQRGGEGRDSLSFAGVSTGERRAHAGTIVRDIVQRNDGHDGPGGNVESVR